MDLNIQNETSELRDVVVCWGHSIPNYQNYSSADPEFTKYHKRSWDKKLLLKQQEEFFKRLEKYDVRLHFPETSDDLIWQIYTRDTGFVIRDRFFYSQDRGLRDRAGEIAPLLKLLEKLDVNKIVELKNGRIEGGDVLVSDRIYVGNGSRTTPEAIEELLVKESGQKLLLGENVMHLDTRLTLLPNDYCLIFPDAFVDSDLELLRVDFKFISVLEEELVELGTNVLVINPETIFSPKHNIRINEELRKSGFKVEEIDYTEPINLGGSFRCTTLPLVRG